MPLYFSSDDWVQRVAHDESILSVNDAAEALDTNEQASTNAVAFRDTVMLSC